MALMTEQRASLMSPLQLAFMGDSVCDMIARTELMFTDYRVKDMHAQKVARVNAKAQAKQLDAIMHMLTEAELAIVKRARNTRLSHTIPQAASREEYLKATGFEALIGYLYLIGQIDRARELFDLGLAKE